MPGLPQAPSTATDHGLGLKFLAFLATLFFFILLGNILEIVPGFNFPLNSRLAFPLMTSALLLVITNFILGAAAHTKALPALVHEGLSWLTFVVCVATLWREYRVLGANNRLIEEAGQRQRGDSSRARSPLL